MKQTIHILFLIIILAFNGCKKDDVKVQSFNVVSESVDKQATSITITINYTYPSVIKTVEGYICENSNMDNATIVHGEINGKTIKLKFNDLQANTTYYYYYEYSNGIDDLTKSETKTITTNDYGLPTVTTNEITDITATSAICEGEVTDNGEAEITARGVCYGLNENPTIDDNYTIDSVGLGSFHSYLGDLSTNTTYYVRAYATNQKGTSYGEQKSFITTDGLPTVTTMEVTDITATTVSCGGNVVDDGGFAVTARGVCYSTSPNPTIDNSHTNDGTGLGSFTSELTGLEVNTSYYVRAYATNSNGTSYGTHKVFATLDGLPIIMTNDVINVTNNSAICGGIITSDGGLPILERGVCWSTNQYPTVNDSHTMDGDGIGSFMSMITGLTVNTTYYVRAYVINSYGSEYGEQKIFFTTNIQGAIESLFSVSGTQKVYFSKGNLQYIASSRTWRFADNQYDYIGLNNSNISSTYNGWIDLFGWGTGSNPTNTGFNYTFIDWGNNAISNGGNTLNSWRTLTKDEWVYVFNIRNTVSGIRYAKAKVNGVNGIILFPDDWDNNTYTLNMTNTTEANFDSNIISSSVWTMVFEANGAIFLSAAGGRLNSSVTNVGTYGCYWSSTYEVNNCSYYVLFRNDNIVVDNIVYSNNGLSVRLVCDAE